MNLQRTRAPHVRTEENSTVMMRDVAFALLAPMVMAIFLYGFRVLFIVLTSVLTCFLADTFCLLLQKKKRSGNISPLVTGMIIALLMPASVNYSVVIAAGLFAILVAKHPFGGLGNNIFNPACAGVAFAMVCWNSNVMNYPDPSALAKLPLFGEVTTKLTPGPAAMLQELAIPISNNFDLLFGKFAGPMGTTNVLILAVCAIFLLYRKVISWHIPVSFMTAAAIASAIYPRLTAIGVSVEKSVTIELCVGAIFFCAIFGATDPVTSPTFAASKLIYGAGCGALTMIFRFVGNFPEGVMFSILIMNALSGFIDKFILDSKSGNSWRRQLKQSRRQYKESEEYLSLQGKVEEDRKKRKEEKEKKQEEAAIRRAKQAEEKAAADAKKAEETAALKAAAAQKAEEEKKKREEEAAIRLEKQAEKKAAADVTKAAETDSPKEIKTGQEIEVDQILGTDEKSEKLTEVAKIIDRSEEDLAEMEKEVEGSTQEKEMPILTDVLFTEVKNVKEIEETEEKTSEGVDVKKGEKFHFSANKSTSPIEIEEDSSKIPDMEENAVKIQMEEESSTEKSKDVSVEKIPSEISFEEISLSETEVEETNNTIVSEAPIPEEPVVLAEPTEENVSVKEVEKPMEKEPTSQAVEEAAPAPKKKQGFTFDPFPELEISPTGEEKEASLEEVLEFKEAPIRRKNTSKGGWDRKTPKNKPIENMTKKDESKGGEDDGN